MERIWEVFDAFITTENLENAYIKILVKNIECVDFSKHSVCVCVCVLAVWIFPTRICWVFPVRQNLNL